ncbi:helix-turn-helix domain-containing protein [Macellibacteroides fermentans]|uniref:helix-turn-helix domain-containing protein n=1 Tax=Macellibacteroides fermentans TaxID=879969 RepID=UPI003B95397F
MKSKIQSFINSKRESDYWDFKREPHENNAALLHDILCLSNSLHKGDKYLIIGVSDPSESCVIIGLTNGQKNRKNQSNLIDFLRQKSFAGGLRPEIEIETILINEQEIDVLIIKDRPHKPYYLTSDFRDNDKCVKANHIYTRVVDTNTPINSSADLYYIEKMWHQRFGLDLIPSERFKRLLLKPNEWFKDFGNGNYAYHESFPEFRIELTEPEGMWEPYCEFYPNNKGYYGKAFFKYQLNTLFELNYVYCDEMRIMLANPRIQCVRINKERNWFYYYDLSNWDGAFHQFLHHQNNQFSSRGSEAPFLVFNNKENLIKFTKYLEENANLITNTVPLNVPQILKSEYTSPISLEFLCKVKMIYDNHFTIIDTIK